MQKAIVLAFFVVFNFLPVRSQHQLYPLNTQQDVFSVIKGYEDDLDSLRQSMDWERMAEIGLGIAEAYYDLLMIEQFRQATDSAAHYLTYVQDASFYNLQKIEINKARYANFYVRPEEALGILEDVKAQYLERNLELPYIYYETIATTYRNVAESSAEVLEMFYRAEEQLFKENLEGTIYEARLYRSVGNTFLDGIGRKDPEGLDGAIHYYQKALKVFESSNLENHPIRFQLHVLMGLTYSTVGFFNKSEQAYTSFFDLHDQVEKEGYNLNNYLAIYLNAVNWSTWNILKPGDVTEVQNIEKYLVRLKKAEKRYADYSRTNKNPTLKIFLNTYRHSPYTSIAGLYAKWFELTGDERLIDSLLFYSEKSKAEILNYQFDANAFISVKNRITEERAILHFEDAGYGSERALIVTFMSDSLQTTKMYYGLDWLNNFKQEVSQLSEENYKRVTHRIYNTFIRPVERYLDLGQKLAIIPNMDLQKFSFEALVVDTTKSFFENPFLWNSYSITQHPAVLSLAKNKPRKFEQAVSIIAPNYEHRELSDLRFTQNLFKTHFKNAKVYSSDLTGVESSILLISAHATSREETGGLSFISFEDRDLEISDLDSLNVQTDFAVLVMCNASNGKRINSSGFYSITSAFMRYGANSCIGSLWSIDDFTTAQILDLFFDNLSKGMSKDEALEKAKRTFLMSSETNQFYQPMYWAGLHAVGDLSPIEIKIEPIYPTDWIAIIGTIIFATLLLTAVWLARHILHPKKQQPSSRVR
jgi:hypothetical protein